MVSAAAVTAVRSGSRWLFLRASAPAAPVIASIGFPSAKERGATTWRARGTTPTKSSTAPAARSSNRGTVDAAGQGRRREHSDADEDGGRGERVPCRPESRGRQNGSSRTAAIGGTRVARRADRSVAATVTSSPRPG